MTYSKYLEKEKTSSQATAHEAVGVGSFFLNMEGKKPWSQQQHSFTFTPIVPIDEFFKDLPIVGILILLQCCHQQVLLHNRRLSM